MKMAIEQGKSELTALTAGERAELAHFLIESVDVESEGEVEVAWEAERSRRSGEIKTGQVIGKPADQVFAEIRAKHS